MSNLAPHNFTETELVQIRQDCARGLAEIDAGLGITIETDADLSQFIAGIEADADELSAAKRRDRER